MRWCWSGLAAAQACATRGRWSPPRRNLKRASAARTSTPSLAEKAAALAYALVQNHAFIDGNKRIGHAAMEVFLLLNGYEITATVDDQEALFLSLAAGEVSREALATWIAEHVVPYP